ncbi:hypothetical protein [Singulisphaera acidiphila]|uniref:Glycosyltransferase family 1 protein n=1 Tax=Singulisphaera acidiphila (strain ATCC BAA-1392 / DSM 18658 / VKM B-2454 / MOB10) TaxID=886293 RepID=L0DIF5_SINAD|nr:hypothetical protein [Singulisphaera acidiphila]AGA28598.1 hypothetical protein Sinac_4407 [Singulisphaera acidiphila DSM 18658]
MRDTIVIAGAVARRPGCGGHAWVFLQYLLGFRRLGWDVLFLDELEIDPAGDSHAPHLTASALELAGLMERFGLGNDYSLNIGRGTRTVGLARADVLERVGRSAFLLNVMGYLADEEILARAPRRVFLDIDPGFGQIWKAEGLADIFQGHDDFVTIGENIGRPECVIPTCGLHWLTTPQPVVLEQWPSHEDEPGRCWSSVMSWRGAFGPLTYQGQTYGLRPPEFRKFATLPRQSGRRFELALDIHPDEVKDLAMLAENHWSLVNPAQVAGDPWRYRTHIQGSRAEFMVAKNLYVKTQGGWLSDRSLCYLASGRPVLAQDTGIQSLYPTGLGLLTFSDLDEATAGVEIVERDHAKQARGARALAEEFFDSDRVLGRLLNKLGIA